jgi:hypothetical protein
MFTFPGKKIYKESSFYRFYDNWQTKKMYQIEKRKVKFS